MISSLLFHCGKRLLPAISLTLFFLSGRRRRQGLFSLFLVSPFMIVVSARADLGWLVSFLSGFAQSNHFSVFSFLSFGETNFLNSNQLFHRWCDNLSSNLFIEAVVSSQTLSFFPSRKRFTFALTNWSSFCSLSLLHSLNNSLIFVVTLPHSCDLQRPNSGMTKSTHKIGIAQVSDSSNWCCLASLEQLMTVPDFNLSEEGCSRDQPIASSWPVLMQNEGGMFTQRDNIQHAFCFSFSFWCSADNTHSVVSFLAFVPLSVHIREATICILESSLLVEHPDQFLSKQRQSSFTTTCLLEVQLAQLAFHKGQVRTCEQVEV